MSTSELLLEIVCPAAGTITATIMFSAPYRDAAKAISETGQLGDLNPTPFAFMLGNCLGWVGYGMLVDNLFIYFANAPGFILSVWLNLVAVKLQYENHKSAEMRKSIIGALRAESSRLLSLIDEPSSLSSRNLSPSSDTLKPATEDPEHGRLGLLGDYARIVWDVTSQHKPVPAPHERLVLGIVIYWVAVITIIAYGKDSFSGDTQETIVGVAVNLNLVFFYGAPLSTIFTVLKERNSASIHIPLVVTSTANGLFWFAFGLAVQDFFIIVPNGLGAMLGLVEIFLCVTYPRKKRDTSLPPDSSPSLPSTAEEQSPDTHEEKDSAEDKQEKVPSYETTTEDS